MNNQFLFELGTEEIPAEMIEPAVERMKQLLLNLLEESGVEVERILSYCTPRRLALLLEGLPDRQPDQDQLLTGPPEAVAFDAQGEPTQAARGFARKLNVEMEELELASTDRGVYLSLRRKVKGKDVCLVLQDALGEVVRGISWPKNMYWSSSRFRFIRPLRWFVALWNQQVVPFEFEGVRADNKTRGHRSLGQSEVVLETAGTYVDQLRQNFVLVDPQERLRRIEEGLKEKIPSDCQLLEDCELLSLVVHLTEYPTVLRGEFSDRFLNIPQEVLVTVMRHHQKYFSMLDRKRQLAPYFLTVANTNQDADGRIQSGHEKVLNARLQDAAFFWETDLKSPLEERLPALEDILFQEQLGSYGDKTRRLQQFLGKLHQDPELDRAAQFCKADLTTEMVREFAELQGVMGGLYARQEGFSGWRTIYEHYQPVSLEDSVPTSLGAALLSVADRLDTIVGCFGVGIVPTGSSDPFALRRQAQGLIKILLEHKIAFLVSDLIRLAQEGFEVQNPDQVHSEVLDFLRHRIRFVMESRGFSYDTLNAILSLEITSLPDLEARAGALERVRKEPGFEALAIAFKRVRNILEKQGQEIVDALEGDWPQVESERLVEPEEQQLYESFRQLGPRIHQWVADTDYDSALEAIAATRGVVDRFFDTVMVMVEEPDLRLNRLALLKGLSDLFLRVADISQIVQKGGGE